MYKIITFIIAATLLTGLQPHQGIAQAPEKFNYQAIVYKSNGQLLKNRPVGLRFSILQGSAVGSEVYIETQNVMTNNNGLVDALIGDGNAVLGTYCRYAASWDLSYSMKADKVAGLVEELFCQNKYYTLVNLMSNNYEMSPVL